MLSRSRRLSRRGWPRRITLVILAVLVAAASSLTSAVSAPPAAQAQTPVPPRPLILIGGTFTPVDFAGTGDAPSWDSIIGDWLGPEGGYTEGVNLHVWELKRLPTGTPPPNWANRHAALADVEWADFLQLLQSANVSTAGLVPMIESVVQIRNGLNVIASQGQQVDIVGHSQGGFAARAAIRQLKEDGVTWNDNVVNRLVMLGSPHYGVATEQEPEVFGLNFFGLFGELVEGLADQTIEDILAHCRDNGWLPLCPDLFRRHSDFEIGSANDWRIPNPANPSDSTFPGTPPYEAWDTLYVTPYFQLLNHPDGVGPTPGPTSYYNLHSVNYPGTTTAQDARIAEPALWSPPGSTNVQNWTPQAACGSSYEVSHTSEWGNSAMRSLMGYALGFKPLSEPVEC